MSAGTRGEIQQHTATSGAAYTVTVVDAYGNKVKNDIGPVRFCSSAGGLGLPADYTFTPDDAGTHTSP